MSGGIRQLLHLLFMVLILCQNHHLVSAARVQPETVEIEPNPEVPKTGATSNKYGSNEAPPKGMSASDLSPEMIKNLKASLPNLKAAPGVELPDGGDFDFQKMILDQLEREERERAGGGAGGAGGAGSGSKATAEKSVKLTLAELSAYDGSDPSLPLYLSIRKRIYDMSSGSAYYGIGGPLNHMLGKEVTRALATGCFESTGLTSDIRGLEADQLTPINIWQDYIKKHYKVAGWLKGLKINDAAPIPDDHCVEAEKYRGKEPM